jgi:copper chaperone CopZ
MRTTMVGVVLAGMASVAMVSPETKVELKKVHLCCGACEKAIGAILKEAGAQGTCSKDTGTVSFTAADEKAAQKVLDAIAAAGFHGDTGNKDLAIKDDSGVKEGKVESLTLTGIHNCCPQCCKAIKAVVGKVEGVTGEDVKPKEKTFTVKGSFDGKKLIEALNAAGFHAKVEEKK